MPAAPSWPSVLGRLAAGLDLDADSARWALAQVMAGEATPAQIGALLLGLQAKGPTADEVAAAADAMRAAALPVEVPGVLLDVVGTGGDSSGSVNFSTMAAIVAAACGATIIKHGNRAASSKSGTADVLEESSNRPFWRLSQRFAGTAVRQHCQDAALAGLCDGGD